MIATPQPRRLGEIITEKDFTVHERSRLCLWKFCGTRFAGANRATRRRIPMQVRSPAATVNFKMQHATTGSSTQKLSFRNLRTFPYRDGICVDFTIVNSHIETRMVDQYRVHRSTTAIIKFVHIGHFTIGNGPCGSFLKVTASMTASTSIALGTKTEIARQRAKATNWVG